jgi:hypothetical protein
MPAEGPYVVRDADSPVPRTSDLADAPPAPNAPPPTSSSAGLLEPPDATR